MKKTPQQPFNRIFANFCCNKLFKDVQKHAKIIYIDTYNHTINLLLFMDYLLAKNHFK